MDNIKKHEAKEDIAGKIFKLIDMVNYQEGSIVSRMIIKKDVGNVTLFAFAEGQDLSEHTVPFDALVYIFDGEAEITIDSKPRHLKSGEMIIMPAKKSHSVKAVKRFKMVLTMIKK